MFNTGKSSQALKDNVVIDVQQLCRDSRSHGVVLVVLAFERELFGRKFQRLACGNNHLSVTDISNILLLLLAKRIKRSSRAEFLDFTVNHRITAPIDKRIFATLVTRNAHLGVDIVLELKVVAVQVVGCDIEQNSNVCTEIVHIIQLERTEFNHIVRMILLRHLQSEGVTDVSRQTDIQSRTA